MKTVLNFLKELLILIGAIIFCIIFFPLFYIVYGIWYLYQKIKLFIKYLKKNGTH